MHLLLPRDAFARFDQDDDGIGENGYPRDPTEASSKPYTDLCKSGDVHLGGWWGWVRGMNTLCTSSIRPVKYSWREWHVTQPASWPQCVSVDISGGSRGPIEPGSGEEMCNPLELHRHVGRNRAQLWQWRLVFWVRFGTRFLAQPNVSACCR